VRMIGKPASETTEAPGTGARAGETTATFRVPDPGHRLAGVRLHQEIRIPGDLLDFHPGENGWELVIDRPAVNRMEYKLEFRYPDGATETVTDPGNPHQAPGAFGPKSVLEFPGYTAPGWVTAGDPPPGDGDTFDVPIRSLDAPVMVRTWCPPGTRDGDPLPMLVAHDGPEYDSLASLTRYLSAGTTAGWLPPLRAALLSPGPRDRWYSASARYARALQLEVIPALAAGLATTSWIGMGASLGALAMLHAHCRYPGVLNALFLQSGSFFTPSYDSHERRFPHYRRITRFVAETHRAAETHGAARSHSGALHAQPIPVTLTCGAIEENVHNNRLMTATLQAAGYPAALHEVPDVHNFIAWRDAFDPHLTALLHQAARLHQAAQ
jgi:enterochelin esterase-like enzyme